MFDPKCYELAEYFLKDEPGVIPDEIDALAQNIQEEVETWLAGREAALHHVSRR